MRSLRIGMAAQAEPSDLPSHDSTLRTHRPRARLTVILWLAATVLAVGPVRVAGPRFGLDPGWAAGLNLGRQGGLRYGGEVVFTYGPWGFLDVPLAISRPDFVMGLGFSVASVVAAWLFTFVVFRSKLHPTAAPMAASLFTLAIAGVSTPSILLTTVALVACVRHLHQIPALSSAWCPVVVAGLAALLLQVKFSEGLAVTVFAFGTSLLSPRARLMRTLYSGLAWVVTSLALWIAAGQSPSDIAQWLRASMDLVAGYTDAMSLENFPTWYMIPWYAMALLLIVSAFILEWIRCAGRGSPSNVGGLLVTAAGLFFGFKQAFTRHSLEHNAAFFVIAAVLLCALLERGPRWRATALLIALATVMASPPFSTFVRANPVDSWALTWRFLTSDASQSALLNRALTADQAAYALPKAMVEATHGHAVSVDPWEVSMVWAYSMKWRPMLVFQSYSAYTPYLDQLNADTARQAGDDQMIIRATSVQTESRPTIIDGRNPMWESPRYTLAVVCNYSVVTADKRWMLLRKSINRCGEPSATTARRVMAGEVVIVPSAGPHGIVVTSFVPTEPNYLVSLSRLVFKGQHPLIASVDDIPFRLTEGFASGPLLTATPPEWGWPTEFRGQTSPRSVSFSRPGTVEFRTIQLTS